MRASEEVMHFGGVVTTCHCVVSSRTLERPRNRPGGGAGGGSVRLAANCHMLNVTKLQGALGDKDRMKRKTTAKSTEPSKRQRKKDATTTTTTIVWDPNTKISQVVELEVGANIIEDKTPTQLFALSSANGSAMSKDTYEGIKRYEWIRLGNLVSDAVEKGHFRCLYRISNEGLGDMFYVWMGIYDGFADILKSRGFETKLFGDGITNFSLYVSWETAYD